MMTWQPRSARTRTVSAPMPDEHPVTMAVRPLPSQDAATCGSTRQQAVHHVRRLCTFWQVTNKLPIHPAHHPCAVCGRAAAASRAEFWFLLDG